MNSNINIVLFKNISKKSGKVYYSVRITQIVYGVVLVSNCFITPTDAKKLVENGIDLVDMTKK